MGLASVCSNCPESAPAASLLHYITHHCKSFINQHPPIQKTAGKKTSVLWGICHWPGVICSHVPTFAGLILAPAGGDVKSFFLLFSAARAGRMYNDDQLFTITLSLLSFPSSLSFCLMTTNSTFKPILRD